MRRLFPRTLSFTLFLTLLSAVIAGGWATEKPLELPDLQGRRHTPIGPDGGKPVVLIFISPYCPTANAFLPEINRIAASHGRRAAFYLVQSDPAVTVTDAAKQVELYGVTTTVLLDAGQRLARLAKASVTPEAVVFGAGGAVLYRGRINDLYLNRTRKQPEPKSHDLIAALDAILAGQSVPNATTKAIGCSIPAAE